MKLGDSVLIMEMGAALFSALLIFYVAYFLLMRKKCLEWDSKSCFSEPGEIPSVSVIIPAYNEEKSIVRKLENLREQAYPIIEVVVVNDGSTDDTAKMVRSIIDRSSSPFQVQLVNLSNREGKASALNHAWRHCKGEIIIISDADTILGEDTITHLVSNFRDPNVGAVTGKLSMINYEDSSSTRIEKTYRNIFDMLRLGESCMDSTPVFNGGLVALRRSLFENLKSDTLADDTEISLRIREKGYKAIFDPTAKVYAFTPKSFKFRAKQKIRRAQGIIQSLIWHRQMLFNRKYGKYGLIILPCEFFMHIISPILLVLTAILFLSILLSASFALTNLAIILGFGIVVFGLISIALSCISKNRNPGNSTKIFVTFLEHQIFLALGLLFLLLRKGNSKWDKIE